MKKQTLILLVLIIVSALLISLWPKGEEEVVPQEVQSDTVTWTLTEASSDDPSVPKTQVQFTFRGKTYDAGIYSGSCAEVEENGGIDGTGLLPNEIAAVQCWFAGGGNEIGIFKYDDFYIANLGILEEGDAETPFFRGTFEGLLDIE